MGQCRSHLNDALWQQSCGYGQHRDRGCSRVRGAEAGISADRYPDRKWFRGYQQNGNTDGAARHVDRINDELWRSRHAPEHGEILSIRDHDKSIYGTEIPSRASSRDESGLTSRVNILLATSFHEHLEALPGFHLNWQAALSGRVTTIAHLSQTTRRTMLAELAELNMFPSAAGLIINPVSVPTRFGSALPMLIHNDQWATRMGIESSHICLASPYLYALQPSLDDSIERYECGLPATIYDLHPNWHWHDIVANDSRMIGLANHLQTTIKVGRADGVFMTRSLFNAMLELVDRFFGIKEIFNLNPLYPLEEVLFPTVLPVLLRNAGRIGTTRARVWEPGDPPTTANMSAAISSGLHACGKRIPQTPGDLVRDVVLANLPGKLVLNSRLGTTIA